METPGTISSLTKLAKALEISKGYASKLSKRAWFPSGPPWVVEDVALAIGRNVRPKRQGRVARPAKRKKAKKKAKKKAGRKRGRRPPAASPADPPACEQPAEAPPPAPAAKVVEWVPPPELLDVLGGGDRSALEMARAVLHLKARQLSAAIKQELVSPTDLRDFKDSLAALRAEEEAHLKLGVRRGDLIPRAAAAAVGGQLAQRMVTVLGNVEALIATQVEIWSEDVGFLAAGAEGRRRVVQEWFSREARLLREVEADDLERMLEEEAA